MFGRPNSQAAAAGGYMPPANFGYVEEDLYRSGAPNTLSFAFLERLNLKKIIYLSPEEPSQQFLNFVDDQEIEFEHIGREAVYHNQSPWNPISEEVVISALKVILEAKSHPLLIMCNLGRHRTGTVVGALRKLQRWNLTSILEEYRRYAGNKVRILNEQFIELFDTDLVTVPQLPPPWWRPPPPVDRKALPPLDLAQGLLATSATTSVATSTAPSATSSPRSRGDALAAAAAVAHHHPHHHPHHPHHQPAPAPLSAAAAPASLSATSSSSAAAPASLSAAQQQAAATSSPSAAASSTPPAAAVSPSSAEAAAAALGSSSATSALTAAVSAAAPVAASRASPALGVAAAVAHAPVNQ